MKPDPKPECMMREKRQDKKHAKMCNLIRVRESHNLIGLNFFSE